MEKNINEKYILTQEEFFRLCILDNYEAKQEISSYVRCKICKLFLEEPLYCITCNSTVCKNCHKKCNSNLHSSRHIKTILENIKFKCSYDFNGCNKELDYMELIQHIQICNKKTNEKFPKNIFQNLNNNNNIDKNYKFSEEDFDLKSNLFFFYGEKNEN